MALIYGHMKYVRQVYIHQQYVGHFVFSSLLLHNPSLLLSFKSMGPMVGEKIFLGFPKFSLYRKRLAMRINQSIKEENYSFSRITGSIRPLNVYETITIALSMDLLIANYSLSIH